MKKTISGRNPFTEEAISVTVDDGAIAAIGPASSDETAWLSPGLIDLQVNGYMGYDLNDHALSAPTVGKLAAELRAAGVTTFLPTIITASKASIIGALRAIAAARAEDPVLKRMIPFVHVEGPHISPNDGPRGAHPRDDVRPPDLAEFADWQTASGDLVGLVTLSPHFAGATSYIEALTGRGVHVAIGHTDASPAQIAAAVDAGAVLSTHLGNGAAAMLPRHPNFLWTQLAEDRLTASFIADGHHLPADTFNAMVRAKSIDRSILVSDTVSLGGMPPNVYSSPTGNTVELTETGRLQVQGTPYLEGAAVPLSGDVARAVDFGDLSLGQALTMATKNPGRFVNHRGRLAVGEPADLIRFDWSPGDQALKIETVLVGGVDYS
jgi:N-acetylglucosamine-6-phosphate deacetylase